MKNNIYLIKFSILILNYYMHNLEFNNFFLIDFKIKKNIKLKKKFSARNKSLQTLSLRHLIIILIIIKTTNFNRKSN